MEVARSGALEAFGSLEEWLKAHPEVGRTEKGTHVIQGYAMAQEEKHEKISISVKYVLYYIDFYNFFFIWYDFYIRTFILVNERNRQKNNIYIYIFLHLIFDHVPLLPFKKPQICAIHQLRQVASLMGSNSPWQM